MRFPRAVAGFVPLLLAASPAAVAAGPVRSAAVPAPSAAGEPVEFTASLLPAVSVAEPQELVTVGFVVDENATQFNAFEVTLQFDPAIVEFVSVAQGSLMSDVCQTFQWDDQTDTTVTYVSSLLCAGGSVSGPGELASFTFRALADGTSPVTIVSDPDCTFLDAGICVSPNHPTFPRQVHFEHASILVGDDPTAVPPPDGAGLRLRFAPNPARDGGVFRLPAARGPLRLTVHDAAGRRVLSREWRGGSAPGETAWTARDTGGRPLPAGVYFARLRGAGVEAATRIVLLR